MCSSVVALATIYGKGCIAKTSKRTGQHYQLFYNRALLLRGSCRCTIRKQSLTRLAQLCKVYSTIVQEDWVGRLTKSLKKSVTSSIDLFWSLFAH
jgi:hypothetical protein